MGDRSSSFFTEKRLMVLDWMPSFHCLHRSASWCRMTITVLSAVLHWYLEEKICNPLVPQSIPNCWDASGHSPSLWCVLWARDCFFFKVMLSQVSSEKCCLVVLKGNQTHPIKFLLQTQGKQAMWVQDNPFGKWCPLKVNTANTWGPFLPAFPFLSHLWQRATRNSLAAFTKKKSFMFGTELACLGTIWGGSQGEGN